LSHPEQQLISHIIRKGDLEKAIEWGIEEEDFGTDEGRSMFMHMTSAKRDPRYAGAQFGENVMRLIYPMFKLIDDSSMTIEGYCQMVRKERLIRDARTIQRELVTSIDAGTDPLDAAMNAQRRLKTLVGLGYGMQADVAFAKSIDRLIAKHDTQSDGTDLSACKFPWEPFNKVTLGIQPDDYIVFYGRPKSMKSWVLAYIIADIYDQGKVPLIYTKEMTADNIFMRIAACIARLPYQELRTGKLNRDERIRLSYVKEIADGLMNNKRDMICLNAKDVPSGGDTVEWLHSKVSKYGPDVVAIDGLYLMSDGRGAKNQKDNFRVQNISRGIRQMVLDSGKPVLATMQATRSASAHKNANLDEIAFSDAISQDVTAAIRVINEQENNTITLAMGGSREYSFSGCRIWGIPATNFSWVEELSDKDINKVKQRDEVQDEADTGIKSNKREPANGAEDEKRAQARRSREDKKVTEERIRKAPVLPRGLRVPQ
jgi:replicative DNA helicase